MICLGYYMLKRIEFVSNAAMKFERKSNALGRCQIRFNGIIGLGTCVSTQRKRGIVTAEVLNDVMTRGCVPMKAVSMYFSLKCVKLTREHTPTQVLQHS